MVKFFKKTFLLFILAAGFCAFAFAQPGDYRRADLWEKEIQAFAELDKRDFPKSGGVLFVGSSSIRGWRTLAADFPEFRPLNRGFGGSHLEDVNYYASRIVFPYRPKLIVLYAGENDLVAGKTIETVFADFKKFVELVEQNLPGSRIIVVSVKPSPSRWQHTPKFLELNRLLKKETEHNKRLLYVDVWTPMLDAEGEPKKEIFLSDRLHLNPEGYKIWREALLAPIKKGLKGNFR